MAGEGLGSYDIGIIGYVLGVLIGMMENKMETTLLGYRGIVGYISGLRAFRDQDEVEGFL